jgi:RHS repeat-associated protein
MRKLLAVALLASVQAYAQTEIVLDNGSAAFSTTGTWPASTSVSGYVGANYQVHLANGAPPAAIMVDNTDPGFSVTGTWTASTAVSGYVGSNYQHHFANGAPPAAVVVDNVSGSASGTWPASTSVGGYVGTNYQHHAAGTGTESFTWTLNVGSAGSYEVYARWTQHSNRATNAKYTVNHAGGQDVVTVDQRVNGASWQLLGTYDFDAGAATVSLSDEANGYVVADAVMLVPPGAAPSTATWSLPVASSGNFEVYARWTQHPNRASNARYTVNHAGGASEVTVNQMAGGGNWSSLGTYSFGAGIATVSLTDQADGFVIADAVMLLPPGAAPNSAVWTPNVAQAGTYEVYARWTQHSNRATDATYTVTHASGSNQIAVDQQVNGGAWNLLGTFAFSPGSVHNVTLTDLANGYVIADAVRLVPVSVQAEQKLYFVHVDHLNTPRLITNDQQQVVWRHDNTEPFADSVPDENPSSLGAFEFPLRFDGTYADQETGLLQNWHRELDRARGQYLQSDPIGLQSGLNTYSYVFGNPLSFVDPTGLQIAIPGGAIGGSLPGAGGPMSPGGGIRPSRPGDNPLGDIQAPGKPTWPSSSSGAEADSGTGQSSGRLAPPGKCTQTQHRRLQDEVDAACKIQRRCDPSQDCPELHENYYKNIRCAQARDEINNTCFAGGDAGHRQAANDARNAAKRCIVIMQQKGCPNCPVAPN